MITSDEKQTGEIEWGNILRRLETARKSAEQGFQLAPEQQRKILTARAKALAREPASKKAEEEYLQVVEFSLAYERYAIESARVSEVYPLKEFTPVPCTPPFVFGMVNVRGRILSVIDIKKFFGLPEKGLGDLNKIIIMRKDEMEFGILADSIVGTQSIPFSDIQPSLPTLTGIRAEYLKGVTKERLVILDAEKILSAEKIVVYEEVLP